MNTNLGELDLTLLIYQPLEDWFGHVEEKYGVAVAAQCRIRFIQHGSQTLLSEALSEKGLSVVEVITEAQAATG